MPADELDRLLVARIRTGDAGAWQDCIARFEGRLLAFVESRLGNRATSEDVVQETFLGLLISLPNYDERTPLESFLFSIAAHKLTDVLRKAGRRPALPLSAGGSSPGTPDLPDGGRMPSSLVRSQERRSGEAGLLGEALRRLVQQWIDRAEFERLKCVELLFVLGWSNKAVAAKIGISEQAVANHKHAVLAKLKEEVNIGARRPLELGDLGLGPSA